MTLSVTHTFVSGIADDPASAAAGDVLPSHWNASHTVSGNLPVSQLNSGTNASASTFWRGDGTWQAGFGPTSQLTADLQIYVSNSGSDSNPGTSGSPYLTIQHAFNVLSKIDLNGFVAYINLATGTYAGAVVGNLFSSNVGANANTAEGSYVQVVGNNATPSNCVITQAGSGGTGCFYGSGQVYGNFIGVFITGVRLNNNQGPTIGADPGIWFGIGAQFVLGTNDNTFAGLVEVANTGNGQPIFSGNVEDASPNGGIFTVNILANLFTNNPTAIFLGLTGARIGLINADYFILGGTLTCTQGLASIQEQFTSLGFFPSVFRLGAGGGYSGAQFSINGSPEAHLKCFGPLSGFSIGTAGSLQFGYIIDSDGTKITQIPGGTGWPAQTTQTSNYSQTKGDRTLVFNGSVSTTLTLLPAATWPGLELWVKNIASQTVVSASANVIPANGSTASTAILAATPGKFALLKSNGTNWEIIASN